MSPIYTSSETFATFVNRPHSDMLRLIRKYADDLGALGPLRLKYDKIALYYLTEAQCLYLASNMKASKSLMAMKLNLIRDITTPLSLWDRIKWSIVSTIRTKRVEARIGGEVST